MSCEQYKEALIETAASGEPLPLDLRAHLDFCASCRAVFDDERRLLAAIDSSLRAAANAPVPPSLIPAVHRRLAQEDATIPKRSVSANRMYLAAAAALMLALIPLLRPRNVQPLAQSHTEATTSSAAVGVGLQPGEPSVTHGLVKNTQPPFTSAIGYRANSKLPPPTRTVLARDVRPPQPDVLVPSEERIALARFVSRAYSRRSLIGPSAISPAGPQGKPLSIEPMQIAELAVQSLEELHRQTDSETQIR